MLGAEVGTGYLHRLPHSCRDTIGQSVERKVRIAESDKNDKKVPVMESHLEMEMEQGTTNPESIVKQPHELGTVEISPQVPPTDHDGNTQAKLPSGMPPPPNAQADDPDAPAKSDESSIQEGEEESRSKFSGLPTPPKMKY